MELSKKTYLQNGLKRFWRTKGLDKAIEANKLALLTGMLLEYSKLELGNSCLNIGWLYRLKEEKMKNKDLSLARDRFIEAYNTESLTDTNMDESKLSYLIGELSRRINDKEKALTWFNTCLNLPSTKINPLLDNMAREQWRKAKEMEK